MTEFKLKQVLCFGKEATSRGRFANQLAKPTHAKDNSISTSHIQADNSDSSYVQLCELHT